MPDVTVQTHVDDFMTSADEAAARAAIGAAAQSDLEQIDFVTIANAADLPLPIAEAAIGEVYLALAAESYMTWPWTETPWPAGWYVRVDDTETDTDWQWMGNWWGASSSDAIAAIVGGYNEGVAAASQAEAEAGTESAIRRFSPERVKQAIVALGIPRSWVDTDVALTANSDSKVATQKATKAYADTKTTAAAALTAAAGIKLDDFAAPDDNTDLDASTTKHGLLVKATAPAAGLVSYVGIGNGETAYTNKALFDTTNPANLGTVGPGTSLVAARRDHIHARQTAIVTSEISDAQVTLAKMANLAQDQFIVRTTASTGVPETATVTAAARTVLDDTTVAAMLATLGGRADSHILASGGYDGGGSVLTARGKIIPVEATGTITTGVLVSHDTDGTALAGSITVTVTKYTPAAGTYSGGTSLGTVTLSSAAHSRVTNLSWAVTAGDILVCLSSGITTCKNVTMTFKGA